MKRFVYVKRLRMELDLRRHPPQQPHLPPGYHFVPWQADVLERHARTKLASFQGEYDSNVFPCLRGIEGCRRLMQEIARQERFLPEATWLIRYEGGSLGEPCDCATIQALQTPGWMGSIQNVGVIPEFRGCGLGRALLEQSLWGFQSLGLMRATLEVTAQNVPAVNLYCSLGFRNQRTSYRPLEEPAVR